MPHIVRRAVALLPHGDLLPDNYSKIIIFLEDKEIPIPIEDRTDSVGSRWAK